MYIMFKLPYVPTADELVDKTFRAGKKEALKARGRGSKKTRDEKLWRGELARVEIVGKIIEGELSAIVKHFPSFEQLPPFYRRLLDLKVDKNKYKKNLGAVDWAAKNVSKLRRGAERSIRRNKDPAYAKQFMGRAASIVKQVSDNLDSLIEVKGILRSFPTLKDVPTIVVAGYPNSGKSTFVRNLTGSGIEVAGYPFTTKCLNFGYRKHRYRDIQVIDSPGLLDRPMGERNKIELEAVLALSEVADVILYLIDPTQDISPQLNLVDDIKSNFSVPVVVAVNKADAVEATDFEGVSEIVFSANNPEECERVFEGVVEACGL